ncbi:hypothetical protein F2Q68_00013454 [Brassica cretica]|uniref:Uncharacterized protein n=1 Tax=Brassica cretica TaxID=69181 RepID=A0A8S9HP60_BRACR|nr:hypothetical protein F2Q68_00013454 [Brassica cretica]
MLRFSLSQICRSKLLPAFGSAREVLDCDGGVTRSGLTTRWRVRVMASGVGFLWLRERGLYYLLQISEFVVVLKACFSGSVARRCCSSPTVACGFNDWCCEFQRCRWGSSPSRRSLRLLR